MKATIKAHNALRDNDVPPRPTLYHKPGLCESCAFFRDTRFPSWRGWCMANQPGPLYPPAETTRVKPSCAHFLEAPETEATA